jgi:hypothetical protein
VRLPEVVHARARPKAAQSGGADAHACHSTTHMPPRWMPLCVHADDAVCNIDPDVFHDVAKRSVMHICVSMLHTGCRHDVTRRCSLALSRHTRIDAAVPGAGASCTTLACLSSLSVSVWRVYELKYTLCGILPLRRLCTASVCRRRQRNAERAGCCAVVRLLAAPRYCLVAGTQAFCTPRQSILGCGTICP